MIPIYSHRGAWGASFASRKTCHIHCVRHIQKHGYTHTRNYTIKHTQVHTNTYIQQMLLQRFMPSTLKSSSVFFHPRLEPANTLAAEKTN